MQCRPFYQITRSHFSPSPHPPARKIFFFHFQKVHYVKCSFWSLRTKHTGETTWDRGEYSHPVSIYNLPRRTGAVESRACGNQNALRMPESEKDYTESQETLLVARNRLVQAALRLHASTAGQTLPASGKCGLQG